MSDEIRICSSHRDIEVPLIATFAFNGAEYWCPYCGANYGIFGAGRLVEATDELIAEAERWETQTADYLDARCRKVAAQVKHEGKWIDPDDLPQEIKDRDSETIKAWRYQAREGR